MKKRLYENQKRSRKEKRVVGEASIQLGWRVGGLDPRLRRQRAWTWAAVLFEFGGPQNSQARSVVFLSHQGWISCHRVFHAALGLFGECQRA